MEMMRTMSATWKAGLLAGFFLFGSAGCSRTNHMPPPKDPDLVIKLRWIKSYPGQSQSQVNTGLFWALSFLGAKLPADAAIISWDGTMATVDVDAAGVAQTRPYFEAADLLVVTSRYEAGPLVVLEAAVVGVPTVGTNVGHLSEWAPAAARVVEPRDSVGLAQALAEILSSEDARLRLAARAHERALAENADVTARRFRQIYSEMQNV
jgi:glycosyltransferase involved in cell wall biosynthesis